MNHCSILHIQQFQTLEGIVHLKTKTLSTFINLMLFQDSLTLYFLWNT